jgi:NADPH2:quinone reductase
MTTETMTKYHGILVEKPGEIDVLQYKNLELPKAPPGHAKVRIYAAGLNFIDIYQRRGIYKVDLPFTPGREASGVIEEVGEGVTEFKVGDRVAYAHNLGAYAEYANVDANYLIHLPDQISFIEGAAFPLQGMTAHYLLHEYHLLKPGETVLIHAAAGGMGLLLTRWAKKLGARVIGTTSNAKKAALAKDAGADEVIIYTEKNFAEEALKLTAGKGVDMIIDGVGKTTFPLNFEAIKLRGDIVIYGSASGQAEPMSANAYQIKSVSVHGGSLFNFIREKEELQMRAKAVLDGLKEGWLQLHIERVLPLQDAAKAQELLQNRETVGKIVLQVRE